MEVSTRPTDPLSFLGLCDRPPPIGPLSLWEIFQVDPEEGT